MENLQLACALCRIGIYTIYRRLCCKPPPAARPELSVVCIGLTGAGKTTLLCLLAGENTENIEPTTGFIIKATQFPNCILNIKEIGGNDKVRPYWKHYYRGAQAVIFVLDSACSDDDLEVATTELHGALEDRMLVSVPCLVLANCQDKHGARSESQLADILELSEVCQGRKWAIHACSRNDVANTREGFAKLNTFLLAPNENADTADKEDKEPDGRDYTRI